MHDLSTFGDHLEGHSEIWEYTKGLKGREHKLVMTADKAGDIWYHASVGEPENAEWLDKALGGSFHEAQVNSYAKRLSDHLGFDPTVKAIKGNRRTLSFKLPGEAVCMAPEKLEEFLRTGRAYNLDYLSDAGYEWLEKGRRLIFNAFPFEQIGQSRIDALQQMPPASLLETIEREHMISPSNVAGTRSKILLDHLRENPEFIADLEARLQKAGIEPKFQIAGSGATGTFLKAGDVVVAIRGDMLRNSSSVYNNKPQVERQPIPHHIQPLNHYQHSNLDVEILPRLETNGIHYSSAQPLREAIKTTPHPDSTKYWSFTDGEGRNIGRSAEGTHYVIDGDAVMAFDKKAETLYNTQGASGWVDEHGVWKQYTEFQPLHEKFNSPLHQQGGKIGTVSFIEKAEQLVTTSQPIPSSSNHSGSSQAIVRAAEDAVEKGGGRMKWVIGGVVAAAAALGAVTMLTKKSHVQRSEERNKNRPTQLSI